ncbi:MAG: hypothetical protein FJY85_01800 [Deltaproteobacteria bacterium]|nr:hypothetical protein [Deltaproteobacteria bacterium]
MDLWDCSDHVLIREAAILARITHVPGEQEGLTHIEYFDARTGVQLREIHPPIRDGELERGHLVSNEAAAAILKSGLPILTPLTEDLSKVVNILEIKQRRLDSVVADSIIDQVRVISDLLRDFLNVADQAHKEERFWLSQQVLTLLRKFSGRELAELENIIEWFKTGPGRK